MKSIQLLIALYCLCIPVANTAANLPKPNALVNGISPKNFKVVFDSFRAHRQQAGIALLWNVSDETIVDFVIERSYDGSNFTQIDIVAPDISGSNRYKDDGVMPGYSYYRIKAIFPDNSFEYSTIEKVRIVKHG